LDPLPSRPSATPPELSATWGFFFHRLSPASWITNSIRWFASKAFDFPEATPDSHSIKIGNFGQKEEYWIRTAVTENGLLTGRIGRSDPIF